MKKILIIDDKNENLITSEAILQDNFRKCKTFKAISGKEGIKIAIKEQPDVILLDIVMPEMDGYQACKKLKKDKRTNHIPIILITAVKIDTQSRIKGLNSGADAFLSKPIDTNEFIAQVNTMLRIKEAEDKLRNETEKLRKTLEEHYVKSESETESRISTEALLEHRYQQIYQFSPDSIIIHDLDMNILDVNNKALAEFGYSKEELLGKKVFELHPETEQKHSAQVLDAMEKKEMLTVETIFVRKDGSVFLAEATPCKYTLGNKEIIHVVIRDITERKQAEKALKEREQHLDSIIQNPVGYMIYRLKAGPDSMSPIVTHVSPSVTDLTGVSNEDSRNYKKWFQNVYPEDLPKLIEANNKVIKPPFIFEEEFRYNHPTKGLIWLHARTNGIPYANDTDNIEWAHGILTDITERKKAEDKIKSSEERLKILFEFAPDAYYLNDLKGTFIDGNKAAEVLMGYKKEELIGKNFLKLKILPAKEFIKASKHLMKNVQGKAAGPDEIILNRKDGSKITVETRTFPVKIKDKTVVLGIAHDITERKQAEEQIKAKSLFMESLIQQSPLSTFVMDSKGFSVMVNEAFLKLYAVPDKDKILGRNALTEPANVSQGMVKYFKEALSGKIVEMPEIEFVSPYKNKKVITRCKLFPILDPTGTLTNVVVMQEDITERKQAERALKDSEHNYRVLFDNISDGIFVLDAETMEVVIANKAIAKIYGFDSEDDITNLNPIDFILPEDKQAVYKIIAEDMFENNLQQTNKFRSITKDGREIWISAIGIKTEYQGRLVGLISIRDITKLKLAEFALNERLKELNCLYGISKITETPDISIEEIFRRIISLVPTTWQYPEITVCRIIMDGIEYKEPNFKKTNWVQGSDIKVADKNVGIIEICYLEKMPDLDEGPFLKEERMVLDAIAERIGHIVEKKQAEGALMESEEKYRNLIVTTSEGFWLLDSDRKTIDVNQSLCDMLGYSRSEMIDKTPFDFVNDENLKVLKEQASRITTTLHRTYEIILKKKNGINLPTIFNATSLIDKKRKPCGSFVLVTDITERKRAEQIQKTLYNISNAVITTDNLEKLISLIQKELGTIIDTTNFYIAFYDRKTDTLAIPFFADEKDNITSAPAGKTLTKYVIDTKKPLLADIELKKKLVKEGKLEHVGSLSKIWLGVPLKIEGKITSVLAVQSYTDKNAFNDSDLEILEFVSEQISISIERKKNEDELKKALKKATESDRLKSAFLTNMSHEIRTPMNGILGFTELLKEPGLTGDDQQDYIEIIEKSGARMLNTINDIISISKIESGQMEVNLQESNINEQIEFLYAFFKPEMERKEMQFLFRNSLPSNEAIIKTDSEKVYTILTNIVKNAIKFSEKGSIEFGYTLKKESKPSVLEFYVKDTGIGIPKDRQKAIFERFIQADITDSRAFQGSGLGLSISKAYVEMLGGKIWVESEEENLPAGKVGGSTFYFTLPYQNETIKDNISKNEILPPVEATPINKHHILIVEDDEISAKFISVILREFAHEITLAITGEESVEVCQNKPEIDLVLMDIKLPSIDGYEATRQIRKFNKDVIIIAQTAYALEGDKEKAIAAGCNDYITKPINAKELKQKINI